MRLIILLLILFSCNAPKKKTLKLALTREITTLDPVNAFDMVSGKILYQVYEPLYQYHYLKRPYEIIPLTAKDLPKISEGGTLYTIQIKKEVKYHNNNCLDRSVTANDYINAFKRLAFEPLKSNGLWLFKNKIVGLNSFKEKAGNSLEKFFKNSIDGVYATDQYTLKIKLNSPDPNFVNLLAMAHISPIPSEFIKCQNNDFSDITIGTGPFEIVKINEKEIKLKKFKDYRKNFYPNSGDSISYEEKMLEDKNKVIPFVSNISYKVNLAKKQRINLFLNKQLDLLEDITLENSLFYDSKGDLKKSLVKKGVKEKKTTTLTIWWLSFNLKDPLFENDINLRKAIAYAIDYNRYLEELTYKKGLRANSLFIPGSINFNPRTRPQFSYNPQLAKKHLRLSKYKGEKIIFNTRGSGKYAIDEAIFIKKQLEKIGIKVKIENLNYKKFLEKSRRGDLTMWRGGWTLDYPNTLNLLQLFSKDSFPPGPNNIYFSNRIFDKNLKKLNSHNDFKLIKSTSKILEDSAAIIPLYYKRTSVLYWNHIRNLRYSDLIFNFPKYINKRKE